MSTFPAWAIRTIGGDGWYVEKFPRTSVHTSSTRQPFDQAARILMPKTINSNCGGKFTFSPHSPLHRLLPPASASSISPRNVQKTLALQYFLFTTEHTQCLVMIKFIFHARILLSGNFDTCVV